MRGAVMPGPDAASLRRAGIATEPPRPDGARAQGHVDRDLQALPVEWVGARLAGPETLLAEAGIAADPAFARDAEALRGCLAEIMDTLSRLLQRVRRGELATPPSGPEPAEARVGWL